jgi:N utilization substance protein A
MMEKVTAALTSAFKRELGGTDNVKIVLDPVKKDMKVYQLLTVVAEVTDPETEVTTEQAAAIKADKQKKCKTRSLKVGSVLELELDTKNFRRLSAQAGKQMIIQAIRDAERERQTREYEDKKEAIITAIVDKVDTTTGNLILDTGTGYATLMKAEQIPGQSHEVGDRVKVFISEVKSGETRGPLVTLSRVHPHFVKRLFELEIPEIQDGTIVIRSVARDAGSRTKIAVESRDENVDAIGSCIGKNGMRIGAILAELGDEKIDIIQYSEDPVAFVCEALSPAKVISAEMDGERTCRVTVAPDQLSLAIGREGQNAKLAAKLTGMKVDIKA